MKHVHKKLVVPLVVVLILLTGIAAVILLNPGATVISLKSEYADFIKSDGVITEVKFHAPANFNVVQLDSESKTNHDEHGNEHQVITYKGSVKKAFFASTPTVSINRTGIYVFVFSDKTVTITDGKIADTLNK